MARLSIDEIDRTARDVLAARFRDAGFLASTGSEEIDFDGEPVIRVVATYETPPAGLLTMMEGMHAIRARLLQQGEDRYVFVTDRYRTGTDEQSDADEDDEAQEASS